ncbi:SPOR domain-containing protein [Erythrobacter aquimaris]|uniref:SPOR domain-containing protein n=1 Tax=Qipengyuania aquimaris TaxID=255984 RepID=A0A6I4TKD5_9SPHN|nr:SPOR domain-containing protein [Qipengyuania aquimaris]MXO96286.1 SPOR domain-containing protein [Qipengyuania aquimaris]
MAGGEYDRDEDWEEGENLELLEDDERLPWLEADDDDDGDTGFATSRIVLLGVLAILLVGSFLGLAWYFLGSHADEPPADGSLIAAPDEPYKSRPENPGGKTYAGTGDTSFAVGEGQTREGRLADDPAPSAAGPSIATTLNDDGATPADTSSTSPEPALSGVAVQVGAFPTRADAQDAWARLMRQTEALNGVRHRVVEAKVDIGTVYRLQAVAGDRASANRLCNALKTDGLPCFVK